MKTRKPHTLLFTLLISAYIFLTAVSCKKDKDEDERKPPSLSFTTGASYTSSNISVTQGTAVKFGLTGTKTEDDLNTFNVSRVYDAGASTTVSNEVLSGAEKNSFTREVNITTRNVSGTEKYSFTLTDADGNITSLSATITTVP